MSHRQSAFQLVGNLSERLNSLQSSTAGNGDTQSDTQSSIPELSQAEELAIKRSSAIFAPIGQTPDERNSPASTQGEGEEAGMAKTKPGSFTNWRPSDDLMMNIERVTGSGRTSGWGEGVEVGMAETKPGSFTNWRPSDDLMMNIERETGTGRTAVWNDDGLEVSKTGLKPIDVIPTHVRGSTPDSVASSGHRRIIRGSGAHTDINMANLHEHAENRTNRPITNLAMSTRYHVQQLSGPLPSTSTDGIVLQEIGENQAPGWNSNKETKEKSRYFLPKFVLFVVTLMIIIAAIVAVVVKFKDDDASKRGNVLPDPITYVECPSRSFGLGDKLNFTCTFDITHEYRKMVIDTDASKIIIRPKDRVFGDGSDASVPHYKASIGSNRNTTHLTFVFDITTRNATCSSAGSYDVIFQNATGKELHKASVNFTIKGSTPSTTFIQRQLKDNCTESVFDATCTVRRDCNNYHVTFYRNKYGYQESLNRYMSCERNFTDADGYTVKCVASLPENLLENYVFLGCKMNSVNKENNRSFEIGKGFVLPTCKIQESCFTRTNEVQSFNCSQKSKHVERLNTANCSFPALRNCFKSTDRQIFTYMKDYDDALTCSNVSTVPVCRLSWCRDYNYIVKNEIPGLAICGQQYEEPYVTLPTTEGV